MNYLYYWVSCFGFVLLEEMWLYSEFGQQPYKYHMYIYINIRTEKTKIKSIISLSGILKIVKKN